ncbi:MAG: GGDEF domain-containing protein [Steroidobacteraceae bacterium]|nr:GGDEF domain-containing protein [Steroidobacteraceae bacterium]
MNFSPGLSEDLPDLPHARQLKAGFHRLVFHPQLEGEFCHARLEESLGYIRANLLLAVLITIAFSAMDALVLGRNLGRIPALIDITFIVPLLALVLAVSFSPRRQTLLAPLAIMAFSLCGLGQVIIQVLAARGGSTFPFPSMIITAMYVYFLAGLSFYYALAVNLFVLFAYLAIGTAMQLPNPGFSYDALTLLMANLIGASVLYVHEKTSRGRFLEAGLLRELVARDGLTGIQNRRMFDQHIQRVWQQAVRDQLRVAVLLIDIDCFKEYNDRYGHQAGDECLRAVASSLGQCARRPLDFVARYGGEEFAIVLYEASREYVAEVLTRIQRSIAELNILHEASPVASRLTVSIGAAYILPQANRTPEGLIQLADEALYGAKGQGRNRVVVMEAEYHNLQTGRFEKRRGQQTG